MINEYKEWYKSKGICVNCGKEKAWNGRLMCPECLEKTKINSERTRSQESKYQRKQYIKKKRELCVTFGICRECLKREATIGKKCLECHVKEVKRNEAKRTKVKKNMRVELGLCYFCGQPAENGYKTCKKHHVIMAGNLSKASRENKKLIKLYLFNKVDFQKEKFNVNDLQYKIVEYVEETNNTYHVGRAYIKGVQYQNDNQSDEIEYFRVDGKIMDLTGDEWLNRVDTVTCGWKDKIYPNDIIRVVE